MVTGSIWAVVGTLIGAIVGAAASILTTVLTNRSTHRMQELTDSQHRAERARVFQRETLLEIQETTHSALRLMARIYFEDQRKASISGSWGRELLPSELDDEFAIAYRALAIRIQRVADDALREELLCLQKTINSISFVQSQVEAEKALRSATKIANEVLPKVGKLLRETY